MNKEKISVVISIYNVEKYSVRCLDSVIKQTYTNLEIILVDDGSTDMCGKIIDKYKKKDNRIKVIHKGNDGLYDARNKEMDIATGEYISFIDSYDFISEDMIEYLYRIVRENNSDISICNFKTFSNEKEIQIDDERVVNEVRNYTGNEMLQTLLNGNTS